MKNLFKIALTVLACSAAIALYSCSGSSGTDNPDPKPGKDFLTNVGGLSKRMFTLGGEAQIVATGAQETDIVLISGANNYECEVTSVAAKNFKFRVPGDMVAGKYDFSVKRGNAVQVVATAQQISIQSFNPAVPDKEGYNLRGRVYCDNKGVEGVWVTDGVDFVQTDADGIYYMNSDKHFGHVYITVPSGYEVLSNNALPQFWKHVDSDDPSSHEQNHFILKKVDNTNHIVLVAADIHLSNRNLYPRDLKQFADGFVYEVKNRYTGVPNVYLFSLGDFAWDIYWYQYWNGEALQNAAAQIAGLPCQFWAAMGNHDNDGHAGSDLKADFSYGTDGYWEKDLKASKPFRTVFGPTHVSMNIGDIHYILIDDINYENDYAKITSDDEGEYSGDPDMGDRNYHAGFRPEVMEWLKKDLSHVSKSTPIWIGYHIPLMNSNGEVWNGEFSTNYQQLLDFVDLFKDFAEVEFASGHTHVNRMRPILNHGTNMYEHNVCSAAGIWWKSSQGTGAVGSAETATSGSLNMCSDGTPAGYMIYDVKGTSRQWKYKAYGFNKAVVDDSKQFKTYDMNSVNNYFTNVPEAKNFITALTTSGIKNNSEKHGDPIFYATTTEYGVGWEPNAVLINVWGYEKGKFAGYGECKLEVIENGVSTDITSRANDAAGTTNPVAGIHDPLSAVSYDVWCYNAKGTMSGGSNSRSYDNHLFKYVAKTANSTLTIKYTDRFGNVYRETMTRPKKFYNESTGKPLYTLD